MIKKYETPYLTSLYSFYKDIKFNEQTKIVMLKEIKDNDLTDCIEYISNSMNKIYDKNNVNDIIRKKREIKQKLDKLKNNFNIIKYSKYYFTLKKSNKDIDIRMLQFMFFYLSLNEFILLPYKTNTVLFKYYNLNDVNEFNIFFKEKYTFKNIGIKLLTKKNQNQKTRMERNKYNIWQRIIFSSNIKTIEDFHPELAYFYLYNEKEISEETKRLYITSFKDICNKYEMILKEINENYKDWYKTYLSCFEKEKKYLYFNNYYDNNLIKEEWIKISNQYINNIISQQYKQIDNYITSINVWFDFLIKENLNFFDITKLEKEKHIRDLTNRNKKTYFEYVKNLDLVDSNKNKKLSVIEDLFIFIKENYYNHLPTLFSKYDRFFNENNKNSVTNRKRIPSSIINIAKEILLRDNYKFNNNYIDNETELKDLKDLNGDKIYWYGYTVTLYILLTYPIRNKQARWLDSGELDEYIIDFEKMEYIKNSNPNAIKGRKECCVQIETDYFSQKKYYILYLNTNKTGKQYKIPYMDNQILKMIIEMIEWNRKYNFNITEPIIATDINKEIRKYSKYEKSVPLFLYPVMGSKKLKSVMSDKLLMKFYCHLMLEVEKEILQKENKTIKLVKEKISFYENKNNKKTTLKTLHPVFDIHSLRVSGISNLIEAGVPPEIVSQFIAGHSSVVMTLYYNKINMEEVSETIQKLHNDNKDTLKEDLEKIESYEDYEKNLLSASKEFNKNNFQLLSENKGYWNIGLSGICSVNCNELGREDKCCPKCKYWITGTPFLIGQVTELNDLMYKIRKKAQKVKTLNLKYIESFSEQIKGEIELLNNDISILVSEWSIRYKFIEQSLSLLNKNNNKIDNNENNLNSENLDLNGLDKKNDKPILLNSNNNLKLSISEENDFGLSYNICNSSDLIEEFDNREAQYELELFVNKILSHNNIEPFLFRLEREESLKVSNMFAKYILENYNNNHIEELIKGKSKLENSKISEIKNLITNFENNLIEYKGK